MTNWLKFIKDIIGDFSGDGGAAQDDSVKASLDLAHTDLDAIIVELSEILDLTRTGADIAVTAAETNLFIDDAPTKIIAGRSIKIRCDEMQAGDTYTFREKYRIESGAAYDTKADPLQLSGVQTEPLYVFSLDDYRYGCNITAQKDAGVDRSFYVEAIVEA